jgi:hypothetical protein
MTNRNRSKRSWIDPNGKFTACRVIDIHAVPRYPLGIRRRDYFSELLIDVNLVFSLAPRPFTTLMIASEMPAAIRPYSIAVAPDSFRKNFIINRMDSPHFHQTHLLDKKRGILSRSAVCSEASLLEA